MGDRKFTAKQQAFIEAYAGNATRAALAAGYSKKTAYQQGARLLKDVEILQAIQKRAESEANKAIAAREEVEMHHTRVMRNPYEETKDRNHSADSLARMNAWFTDKVLVGGLEAMLKDLDDEEIDRRLGQLEAQAAVIRPEVGEGSETVH